VFGAEFGHGGFGQVAAVGDLPFVVEFGQYGASQAVGLAQDACSSTTKPRTYEVITSRV
jgi:hypothetical protein